MTKRKLFANNWKVHRDTPSECYPEIPFDKFMEWRVHGWEILPSHCCIIRAVTSTGKVREYSYKRTSAAERRVEKLMDDISMVEITIAGEEEVQLIKRSATDE